MSAPRPLRGHCQSLPDLGSDARLHLDGIAVLASVSQVRAIQRATATSLLSIRRKRYDKKEAQADAGCLSIKPATCPADIFLVEAAVKDPYETLGVERN